jgi:hypothetical protein
MSSSPCEVVCNCIAKAQPHSPLNTLRAVLPKYLQPPNIFRDGISKHSVGPLSCSRPLHHFREVTLKFLGFLPSPQIPTRDVLSSTPLKGLSHPNGSAFVVLGSIATIGPFPDDIFPFPFHGFLHVAVSLRSFPGKDHKTTRPPRRWPHPRCRTHPSYPRTTALWDLEPSSVGCRRPSMPNTVQSLVQTPKPLPRISVRISQRGSTRMRNLG